MHKKPLVLVALLASAALDAAFAHGGTFPPTPPPAGGGGGATPGDTVPNGPSTPNGPSGPSTPSTPSSPSTPSTPTGGFPGGRPTGPGTGGATPGRGGAGVGAATGGAEAADPTGWESWWFFNKDRYLALKSHTSALEVTTRADEAFLGTGGAAGGASLVSEKVVPALLLLLEKERQQDVVTGATIALARMADGPLNAKVSQFSKAFAPFTADPNQEIAETSVVARGILGDVSSASDLVALLVDGAAVRTKYGGHEISPRTRAFAGFGLGLLGAQSKNEDLRRFVVHHLVRTLREDRGATPDVQVACVIALGLTPLEWSKDWREDVSAPAPAGAARKTAAAATESRETQLECMLALLADKAGDRWVRAHVPGAIARLSSGASEKVRDELARALLDRISVHAHDRDEVVQGCVLALGALGDADRDEVDVKIRTALKAIAKEGDQQSKRFALIALAQGAARRGQSGVDDGTAEVRLFLASRLADGRSHERCWAALALGVLEHERMAAGGESAVNIRSQVLAALRDSVSPQETGAFAIAAGLMRERDAMPILLQKLEHASEPRTLGYLAVAAGLLGDPRAAPPLRAQLSTSRFKPELLRDTAIGLALLEDPALVPALIETLEKANSLASQSAAASVLGWIGDRRTIEPLMTLMARTEATASARAFAAVALGRVCDQDRLPWNAAVAQDFHYRAATVTLLSADATGLLDIL